MRNLAPVKLPDIGFLILAVCLFAGPPSALAAVQELERIVAIVNDDVVLEGELHDRISMVLEQLNAQNTSLPPEEAIRRQVLERIIVEKLQLQLADSNNIQVDDEALNASIREIASKNNMSLEEFRSILEAENHSFASFREELRNQIRINQVRQQMVGNRIKITDQEIENFFASEETAGDVGTEYHLAHILIAVPEAASPEQVQAAQKKAEDVLAQLRAGSDFAEMAVAVSAGQTALQGGDLGWRKVAELPSVAADTIRQMQAGDISDLLRNPSGFHIVKLIDVRGGAAHHVSQTHARHILLKAGELSSADDARVRLEQLRERLVGGEDFAGLARSHSQDKLSASRGGDLGWINPGDMIPRFEAAMDKLQPGEISEPVKTQFGWHLIQVLGRRQHDSTDDYQRAKAREAILRYKTNVETDLWLRRLRDEAYVEYRTDEGSAPLE
jgi:peptidyl-prolyl cis-trans isomerase SurA